MEVRAVLKEEESLLVEAIGNRYAITDPATKALYTFEMREGYRFPVCELPKSMAVRIINSDEYDEKQAKEREERTNKERIAAFEFAKKALPYKVAQKLEGKKPSILESPQIKNFRLAVETTKRIKHNEQPTEKVGNKE